MAASITSCGPALVGQEHRIRALGGGGERAGVPSAARAASNRLVPVTVAGPLCSGLDVFSQAAVMVPPEVGELVAVLDVGAYGFTESMPLFLSHPDPGRGRRPGRPGARHPAAAGPRGVAGPPVIPDWPVTR